MASLLSRAKGCLLGGAIGDALGAPVEFMTLSDIRAQFGAAGIQEFAPAYGRVGAITDDTQMTLFTAEGLVRADDGGEVVVEVHKAYLRWLSTQGPRPTLVAREGLLENHALWSRRAPGATCLSALHANRRLGAPAVNTSKGCGTIMRVAPVGVFYADPIEAFEVGREISRLTHGHPSAYLAAAFFAQLVALLVSGIRLDAAFSEAFAHLSKTPVLAIA